MRANGKPSLIPLAAGLLLLALSIGTLIWMRNLRPAAAPLPVLGEIPEFTLTNQMGQAVRREDLAGRTWVSDIIFTRCPGPCPKMTERMRLLQSSLSSSAPVFFVSLTADPEFDQPNVLEKYADHFGAAEANWWFLTGERAELYRLVTNGFKLALMNSNTNGGQDPNLFFHSTRFIVVDGAGRIRGYYDGLDPNLQKQVSQAIRSLQKENRQ